MKQTVFTLMALAILTLSSCAKRELDVREPVAGKTHTIQAIIDQGSADVKTSYVEGASTATFSWGTGDEMHLVVYNATTPFTADKYGYSAQASGANVAFAALGAPDFTAYPKSGYAVYPNTIVTGGAKDAYTITLPAEYTVTGTNFTAVGVPLIGGEVSEDTYLFKPAVGVLKVTLSNVPTSARKLVLTSGSDNLSGVAILDEIAYQTGILMSDITSSIGHSITVNFPQQIAGSTIGVYIPVPVGTISAGATLEVQDGSGNPIKTTPATVNPITIAQGHLTPLAGAISVEDWNSLGTGKFMDDHGFWGLGDDGRTAGDYASVTIEQNASEPNRYRIAAPYANCTDVATYLPDAAEYLYLEVLADDTVIYDSYQYGNGSYIMFDAPVWGYDPLYQNSRVINKDGSGNPLNIQLAPYYIDFSAANCAENPKIEIVFPGATPMLAENFNYVNNASAVYAAGNVYVTMSAPVTAVKVKVAGTIADAVTELLAGNEDLSFAADGNQPLPLLDADYFLVYMVENAGHGYTFVNGGEFHTLEVPLGPGMIAVSTDATAGGVAYDGGTYVALVDGDPTTYWHSAYESMAGDDYDWNDLDPTYGAYIDIYLPATPLKTFHLEYTTRHNNDGNVPRAMVFAVSNDGTNWTYVDTIEDDALMNVGAGVTVTLPELVASSSFTYLRIGITKAGPTPNILTTPAGGSTSIAEIKLFGINE